MTLETTDSAMIAATFPLSRPESLAAAARFGAGRYRRERDLPGAVRNLLACEAGAILPRLVAEERRCEQARLARSAEYRPAQHVQILSALLAEAAALRRRAAEPAKSQAQRAQVRSCGDSMREDCGKTSPQFTIPWQDTPSGSPAPADIVYRRLQAKASGSEAFRCAT